MRKLIFSALVYAAWRYLTSPKSAHEPVAAEPAPPARQPRRAPSRAR